VRQGKTAISGLLHVDSFAGERIGAAILRTDPPLSGFEPEPSFTLIAILVADTEAPRYPHDLAGGCFPLYDECSDRDIWFDTRMSWSSALIRCRLIIPACG
jgi:hypothetical protein